MIQFTGNISSKHIILQARLGCDKRSEKGIESKVAKAAFPLLPTDSRHQPI
jgi:hypothetical protein